MVYGASTASADTLSVEILRRTASRSGGRIMRSTTTRATAVEGVRSYPETFCAVHAQCGNAHQMPEWRRRALEATAAHGRVAVVDLTSRLVVGS